MSKYSTPKELFTAICDSIRNKTGKTELINHEDIPAEIDSIVGSSTTKPYIDSSKITIWNNFFKDNANSIVLDSADFSGGTSFSHTFDGFDSVEIIPPLVMRKGTNFSSCFYSAYVTEIQEIVLNGAKTSYMQGMFEGCYILERIKITGSIKVNSNTFNISDCESLDTESLLSFLNAFEDNTGGTTYTVYFGATNLAKLTAEEQQIATDKNITLA